ncbi:DnaJ domain-containing protein [Methylomonas sp. 2BW1-5-20]|uniref:DnaJ domain-containing protein n=1 Tax=Methylomonas sp. 2BW1-5-20 TaxID=3376686 RepID=UPI0040523454
MSLLLSNYGYSKLLWLLLVIAFGELVIRIVMLLLVISGVFTLHWFFKAPAEARSKRFKQIAWIVATIVVILLAVSGKLSGLIALIGVIFAFFMRSMPLIIKYAPHLHSVWQRFKGGGAAGTPATPSTSMSKAQAFDILGLRQGATEDEIIQAHRKLISRVHPDRGGSDYLAAQINQAKKVLLSR